MFELMRRAVLFGLVATLFFFSVDVRADGPIDPKSIPEPLKPWTAWALHGRESALCPTLTNVTGSDAATPPQCSWPARLELTLDEKKGAFSQSWHTDAKGWVPLPGDDKRWPLDVKVGATRSVVVLHDGVPMIELESGDHVVSGTFAWDSLPESLQVPGRTALLSLILRGKRINQPNRDASGTVWLQKTVAEEGERMDFVVHRRVVDEVPLILTTRILLNVAGRNREVLLGKVLPAGFVPMALDSQLPARVEPDTRLRVQARPGTWVIELTARSEGPVTELKRPNPDGPWREGEEVWVFDAKSQLRLVDVQGIAAIDPQQTSLPEAWKRLPAYPLGLGDTLKLVEKRRGNAEPPPDHLSLQRTLWLDFDGKGFTESDTLSGTLRRASRLEMLPQTVLGRVSIGGKDQFITHLEGDAAKTGVEVRQGELSVNADSRVLASPSDLPAVGWNHDFHEVSASLHLPPGFRLFHATGVDDVPSTWIKHWTLLELFLALVLSIGVWRLWGPAKGGLALVTFALTFPEAGAPKYILIFVLLAEAMVRALDKAKRGAGDTPNRGLVVTRRIAGGARALAVTMLVLFAVPFLIAHVRHGLFPALAAESGGDITRPVSGGLLGGVAAPAAQDRKETTVDEPAPAQVDLAGKPPEAPLPQAAKTPANKLTETKKGERSYNTQNGEEKNDDSERAQQTTTLLGQRQARAPRRVGREQRQLRRSGLLSAAQRVRPTTRARWSRPGRAGRAGISRSFPSAGAGRSRATQRLHLYLLSPKMNAALAIVRALLVVALVLLILPFRPRRTPRKDGGSALTFAATHHRDARLRDGARASHRERADRSAEGRPRRAREPHAREAGVLADLRLELAHADRGASGAPAPARGGRSGGGDRRGRCREARNGRPRTCCSTASLRAR